MGDDSNEVGRVHLGVVHIFTLDRADVRKGEAMKRWMAKFRALDGKPYYEPLDLPAVN